MGNRTIKSRARDASSRPPPATRATWLERRSALAIPSRWVKRPSIRAGDEVCLFILFAPEGRICEHSLLLARGWRRAGFKLVVVVVADQLGAADAEPVLPLAHGVLVRQNRGYDFGAWAALINGLPEVRQASLLVIANDSVFGPLDTFPAFVARLRGEDADVIGATESRQARRHFQSYCIGFRPRTLRSRAFRRFWRRVRTYPKKQVIRRYELRMLERLENAGLRCAALFPAGTVRGPNPTLNGWRGLIERGMPFLKIMLVRDGPEKRDIAGWPEALRDRGFDPAVVTRHLGLPPVSPSAPAEADPDPAAAEPRVGRDPRLALTRLLGALPRVDGRKRRR